MLEITNNEVIVWEEDLKSLSKKEKYSTNITDIAKEIRTTLKQQYPKCVFSVTTERYSMGQSLHINLMEANFKIIEDFDKIPEEVLQKYEAYRSARNWHETREQIKQRQLERYHQLNQYQFNDDYDPDDWNNGVFLTKAGYYLFQEVVKIVNQYNYDNSDIQTDYFDVNFHFNLDIGKWNKPFKDGI